MKNIIYIILIFSLQNLYSQQGMTSFEMLETELSQLSGKEKVYKLIELGKFYEEKEPLSSIKYYYDALVLVNKEKLFKKAAEIETNLGIQYRFIGKYNESITYLSSAIAGFDTLTQINSKIAAMTELSETYLTIGATERALEIDLKMLRYVEKAANRAMTASAYNHIGKVFAAMKQYQQSMDFFLKAVEIYREIGDNTHLAESYRLVGTSYLRLGQTFKALDILMKSYELLPKNTIEEFEILMIISECYDTAGKYEKASEYSLKAIDLAELLKYSSGIALSKLTLAKTLIKSKDFSNASIALSSAEKIFKDDNNMINYADVLYNQSLIDESNGKFDDALRKFKKFTQLKDSIFSEKQSDMQYRLQVEFQLQNTESRLATLNSQSELQKQVLKNREYLLLGLGVFALSFVGVAFYFFKNYRKNVINTQRLKELNSSLEEKNAMLELNELKLKESNAIKDKFYSIIAHDIRNPLNPIGVGIEILKQRNELKIDSIKQDKIINDLGKAQNMLSTLLENLLQWTNIQRATMPFNPEIINLTAIIRQNQNLFAQNIKNKDIIFFSDVEDELTAYGDYNMVNTIVRNLLSNAIKYTKRGGVIKITVNKKPDSVEVSVIDTGVGMNQETVNQLFRYDSFITNEGTDYEKGTGLGLKLCKEFIEIHKGSIICRSLENSGSTFKFTLPYPQNND